MDGHSRFDRIFPWLYALVYAAVAFAVHARFFPIGDIGTESDFYAELAPAARAMTQGEFSVLNHPYKGPLHPLLLVVAHAGVSDWYRAGVLLNALSAAAGLVLVYRFLIGRAGRAVAILTTIGVSLVYEFFLHAHKASSDLLFFTLCQGAAIALVTARPGWRGPVVAGLFAGLATLTRYNGFFLPVAAVAVWILVPPADWSRAERWRSLAIFAATFVLVLAPWYGLNLAETGRPLATSGLQNIFVEEFYAGELEESTVEVSAVPRGVVELLRRVPLQVVGRYLRNLPRHLHADASTVLGWPLAALVVLGLVVWLPGPRSRPLRRWSLVALVYFLAMATVYHQPRFSFFLLPAYLACATGGVVALFARVRKGVGAVNERDPRTLAVVAAATLVLVAVGAYQVREIARGERYYWRERPLFALELGPIADRHLRPPAAAIMARKPHVAFYAEAAYVPYPRDLGGRRAFLARAWERGVGIIVHGTIERRFHEAPFLPRLDDAVGIERVHDRDGQTLYRLDRSLPAQEALRDRVLDGLERDWRSAIAAGDSLAALRAGVAVGARLLADQELDAAYEVMMRTRAEAPVPVEENRPEQTFLILRFGQTLLALERYDEGRDFLAARLSYLRADPDSSAAAAGHALLAGVLARSGETEGALHHLDRAIAGFTAAGLPDQVAIVAESRRRLLAAD